MNGADEPVAVTITRRFDASPESIFDAWVTPAMVRRWLFTTPETNTVLEVDARVGGSWTIGDRRDGTDYTATGEYLEIDRPRRLVFSFAMPQFSAGIDRITVEIVPDGDGSVMTFTQEGVDIVAELRELPPDGVSETEEGWIQIFETLTALVEGAKG